MSKDLVEGIFFLLLVPLGWFSAPGVISYQGFLAGKGEDWVERRITISRVGLIVFVVLGVYFLVKALTGA